MRLCECHLASVRQRVLLKCAAARLLKAKHLALRMHAASLSLLAPIYTTTKYRYSIPCYYTHTHSLGLTTNRLIIAKVKNENYLSLLNPAAAAAAARSKYLG
jgi:hypothetical protein